MPPGCTPRVKTHARRWSVVWLLAHQQHARRDLCKPALRVPSAPRSAGGEQTLHWHILCPVQDQDHLSWSMWHTNNVSSAMHHPPMILLHKPASFLHNFRNDTRWRSCRLHIFYGHCSAFEVFQLSSSMSLMQDFTLALCSSFLSMPLLQNSTHSESKKWQFKMCQCKQGSTHWQTMNVMAQFCSVSTSVLPSIDALQTLSQNFAEFLAYNEW